MRDRRLAEARERKIVVRQQPVGPLDMPRIPRLSRHVATEQHPRRDDAQLRIPHQPLRLQPQPIRMAHIIGIHTRDQLTLRHRDPAIQHLGKRCRYRPCTYAHMRISVFLFLEDVGRAVGGGVVQDQELHAGPGLCAEAVERGGERRLGVAHGHHDGNKRSHDNQCTGRRRRAQ